MDDDPSSCISKSGQQVLLTKFAQRGARKSGFYCSASTFFR